MTHRHYSHRRRRIRGDKITLAVRFFFPTEIGRVSYIFRTICCTFLLLFVVMISSSLNPVPLELSGYDWLFGLFLVPALGIYIYAIAFVLAPRLRDVGLPRLLAILALVPFLNVVVGLAALLLPTGAMISHSR
jgi:hypothetical protein